MCGTSGTVTDPQMCNVSAMPARTESDTRGEQRRDDEHADEIATGEKGGMDSARRGPKIGMIDLSRKAVRVFLCTGEQCVGVTRDELDDHDG